MQLSNLLQVFLVFHACCALFQVEAIPGVISLRCVRLENMNHDGKLGRHQLSFDQEAVDSQTSKALKPVHRVDPGDESRWDKAAADAYDLDLQQGGDADKAGAVRTLCCPYDGGSQAADVV